MINAVAEIDVNPSADHISELFACMRLILFEGALRLNRHKQRLHLKLLRRRHEPCPLVSCLILFHEIIIRPEDHLLLFVLLEELSRCRSETLDEVHQRNDRRRNLPALKL